MKYKINIILIIPFLVLINSVYAGCGGCQIKNPSIEGKKNNNFVQTIPSTGEIEGFVIASCAKCNLGKINNKKCSMNIKIGDSIYNIYNQPVNHKDAHKVDGICNALRIAYVTGKISYDTFYADNFALIENPLD
ncbi:MAG: hypothetical protein CBB66_02940 [bacterium TMED6]|nr:MAG: hypothetical protein CBB66_02940 [bacterium TMED6]